MKTELANENLQSPCQKKDVSKPELTIDYELTSVKDFFSSGRPIEGQSSIWCDCRWRIWLKAFWKREDYLDVPYFGFYLEQVDDLKEAINVSFELRLLEPGSDDVAKKITISCSFLKRTLKGAICHLKRPFNFN